MPLVGFRPTKARLVMENGKESVLVMKVVLDDDEAVDLTTGGSLKDLGGVLRIRERKTNHNGGGAIGSVVYVAASGRDAQPAHAKFQVNVTMVAEKFAVLLRVASAGRLPAKFFVDAGAREGAEAKAFRHRKTGLRVKVWDNHAYRALPVSNFVMILPIDLPALAVATALAADAAPPVALATNTQVAELMDDMLVFQSDTRNTMFGLICVLGVVALAALAIGLAVYFR